MRTTRDASRDPASGAHNDTPRLLITAGPTYEPIDAVRFIGNRSSGRLGGAVADDWAKAGWSVTMLLGPNAAAPDEQQITVIRFGSVADLETLLTEHLPGCDVLVMAAAVSDYRPAASDVDLGGKRRRGGSMPLALEPTPDLLAGCAQRARPDQLLVGFALEPRAELMASAERKLVRKNIDLIVANPLETMDAGEIEATLLRRTGDAAEVVGSTDGTVSKQAFAGWLRARVEPLAAQRTSEGTTTTREAGDG